eukprot:g1660.t1
MKVAARTLALAALISPVSARPSSFISSGAALPDTSKRGTSFGNMGITNYDDSGDPGAKCQWTSDVPGSGFVVGDSYTFTLAANPSQGMVYKVGTAALAGTTGKSSSKAISWTATDVASVELKAICGSSSGGVMYIAENLTVSKAAPVNCALGPAVGASDCTSACGTVTQTIATQPSNGGTACGSQGTYNCAGGDGQCVRAKCSSIGDASAKASFCGSDDVYDANADDTECAGATCAAGDKDTCCNPKAKCSSIGDASAKATFCGSDDVYDANADDTKCAGVACAAGDKDTCCNPKAKCSSIGDASAKATFCGSDDVYDANADDTKCAGVACAAGDKDTCCNPKQAKCSTIASTQGFCGNGKVYDSSKADADCAAAACDKDTAGDVTACCKDATAPAAKCSTIASTQGFCGNGKVYDSSKADADCAAAACDKDTAGDVTACCKDATAPAAKCSTIASTQGFCGNGKVYDSSKADADCAAAACDKDTAGDVTACCKDATAPAAKCSTIASTQGFCGNGKVYDSSKADADCAAAACDKDTAGDVTACCKDATAPAAKCSTIASTQGFCGNGKVYDTTKANGDCAASTCDTNTAADVTACCKDAPASGTAPSPSQAAAEPSPGTAEPSPAAAEPSPAAAEPAPGTAEPSPAAAEPAPGDGHAHEHSHEDLSAGSTTSLSVLLAGALYLNLAALLTN